MATYDLTDSLVLEVVRSGHRPEEFSAPVPDPATFDPTRPIALMLLCTKDREPWPCSAITQLRTFETARGRPNVTVPDTIGTRPVRGDVQETRRG